MTRQQIPKLKSQKTIAQTYNKSKKHKKGTT